VFSEDRRWEWPRLDSWRSRVNALKVETAVLPRYRTRFSKHQFSQPQLLAILCLMRYEDRTFREAEVRLREHGKLRRVLGLQQVPDHTTMCRFLFRLPEEAIGRALAEVARRYPRRRRRARVAVDATGLSSGAISNFNFFVPRVHHHTKKPLPWRHWLKWLVSPISITICCWRRRPGVARGTTVPTCPPW
jgi:hypothetical protein